MALDLGVEGLRVLVTGASSGIGAASARAFAACGARVAIHYSNNKAGAFELAASIVNAGSIAGRNGGAPGSGLYAAAKAAVHSLTRSMAKEFAPAGIRVNAMAPGVIETPFHAATPPDMLETMRKTIPLGRLGRAEDCCYPVVFLASPVLAGYITGQILDVNGGQFMP